jgi:NAD(P)-dependent dehydrogenase (short-subunit alcohol dehydrogenase family)
MSTPTEDLVLENKVAIITGGASGIGRAVAEELARRGAVVVLADLQRELAEQTAAQIRQSGGRAEAVAVDVTQAEAVRELVERIAQSHGRLDYLFNNAGIAIFGEVRDLSLDDWRKTLDVNLLGVIHGIHAVYPIMVQQGFGHIVNTASAAGLCPTPGFAAYVATKHAVVGISTTLRVEGADLGVRCSVVCPGVINTPLLNTTVIRDEQWTPELRKEIVSFGPIRVYAVDKCAKVIVRGVLRNRAIIVVTPGARLFWWTYRLQPALMIAFMRYAFRQVRQRFRR